jgi:hypothetical protein
VSIVGELKVRLILILNIARRVKGLEVHAIHSVLLVALTPAGSVGAMVISAP